MKNKKRFFVFVFFLLIIVTSLVFVLGNANIARAVTDNTPPTISSPLSLSAGTLTGLLGTVGLPEGNGAIPISGTVILSVTAHDNTGGSGIKKIEFYRNTKILPTCTDTLTQGSSAQATYTCSWSSTPKSAVSVQDGPYTLSTKVYDTAGNISTSSVNIYVHNTNNRDNTDNIKPTVSLTSPSGSNVSATVSVSATATDNIGVTQVEFYKDNDTTPFATTTSSYSTSFDTTIWANNSQHTFKALAYDAAGNVSDPATVTVTVNNNPTDNTAPVITFGSTPVTSITSSTATISWTTDDASDSQVKYGTTSSYGSTTAVTDNGLVTNHSVTLTLPNPNTLYHFSVISKNAVGLSSTSVDKTFTTLASVSGTCTTASTPGSNTYYVSSTGVDNNNSGLCQDHPITLDKANTLLAANGAAVGGDQILFKRGDTFHGTLTILNSGSSGNPIIIDGYGSGDKPIITGFTAVTGWDSTGSSNIYQSQNTFTETGAQLGASGDNTRNKVNMVVVNSNDTPMGRWPNWNSDNHGGAFQQLQVGNSDPQKRFTFTYHSGSTCSTTNNITSNDSLPSSLVSNPNLATGTSGNRAELVFLDTAFTIVRSPICGISGNNKVIQFQKSGSQSPDKNGGLFFIQNDPKTLDQNNEWYYNPSNKKLQMFHNSGAPNNVQVADVENLLVIGDASHQDVNNIKVQNISFKGSNGDSIVLTTPSNITIDNCDITFSGLDAIHGLGGNSSSGIKVTDSHINNIHDNGMDFSSNGSDYVNPYYQNMTISRNTLDTIGMVPGMAPGGGKQLEGIKTYGNNITIDHNNVTNVGLVAIYFNGNYVSVLSNYVDSFDMIRRDSGAIYTWNSTSDSFVAPACKNIISFCGRSYITNNVVSNGGGDIADKTQKDGIYLDNNTNNVEVSGNTVFNTSHGIILNYGNNHVSVHNNIVYNNLYGISVNACRNQSLTQDIHIKNNISVSNTPPATDSFGKTITPVAGWFYINRTTGDGKCANPSSGGSPKIPGANLTTLKGIFGPGGSNPWEIVNNIYSRPRNLNGSGTTNGDNTDIIGRDFNTQTSGNTTLYGPTQSFSDWQGNLGLDAGSHTLPITATLNPTSDIIFVSNNGSSKTASPTMPYINLTEYIATMNNPTAKYCTHQSGSSASIAGSDSALTSAGTSGSWTGYISNGWPTGTILIKNSESNPLLCPSSKK